MSFFTAKWPATGTKQTCFHWSPRGKASEKRNKDNFASFRDLLLLFTQLVPYYRGLFLTIDLFSLGDNLLIPLLFNEKAKFCFHLFAVEPHWPVTNRLIPSHMGSLAIYFLCSYLVLMITTTAREGADASITPKEKPRSFPRLFRVFALRGSIGLQWDRWIYNRASGCKTKTGFQGPDKRR